MIYAYYYWGSDKTAAGGIYADSRKKAIEILNRYYDGLDSNKLEIKPIMKDPNVVQEIFYAEENGYDDRIEKNRFMHNRLCGE